MLSNVDQLKKTTTTIKKKRGDPTDDWEFSEPSDGMASNPIQGSELTGQNQSPEVAHTCPPPGTLSYASKKIIQGKIEKKTKAGVVSSHE